MARKVDVFHYSRSEGVNSVTARCGALFNTPSASVRNSEGTFLDSKYGKMKNKLILFRHRPSRANYLLPSLIILIRSANQINQKCECLRDLLVCYDFALVKTMGCVHRTNICLSIALPCTVCHHSPSLVQLMCVKLCDSFATMPDPVLYHLGYVSVKECSSLMCSVLKSLWFCVVMSSFTTARLHILHVFSDILYEVPWCTALLGGWSVIHAFGRFTAACLSIFCGLDPRVTNMCHSWQLICSSTCNLVTVPLPRRLFPHMWKLQTKTGKEISPRPTTEPCHRNTALYIYHITHDTHTQTHTSACLLASPWG